MTIKHQQIFNHQDRFFLHYQDDDVHQLNTMIMNYMELQKQKTEQENRIKELINMFSSLKEDVNQYTMLFWIQRIAELKKRRKELLEMKKLQPEFIYHLILQANRERLEYAIKIVRIRYRIGKLNPIEHYASDHIFKKRLIKCHE